MYLLCISEFANNLARGLFTLALGFILYNETNSVWAFALTFSSEFIFSLILQVKAGSSVDRWGARRVVLLAAAASVVSMLVAMSIDAFLGMFSVSLALAAILLNAIKPFNRNALFAYTPLVVEEERISKANSAIMISVQCGQLTGMALTGLVLSLEAAHWVPTIIAGCYVVSYLSLYWVKPRDTKMLESKTVSQQSNWREVFDYLRAYPTLAMMFVIASVDFVAIAIFNIVLAPVVEVRFQGDPMWLTYLDSSFAIGAILSGVFASKVNLGERYSGNILTSMTVLSVVMLMGSYIFLSEIEYLPIVLALLFGFCSTNSIVYWLTTQQKMAPEHIRGKLGALRYMAFGCFVTFTTFSMSGVIEYGLSYGIYYSCILIILITLFCIFATANEKSVTHKSWM